MALIALLPGLASWWLPAGARGDRWVLWVAAASGSVLVAWLWLVGRRALPRPTVTLVLLVAVAVRLAAAAGPARFDDDLWRYLWDGAATTSGVSPYEFTPQEVVDGDPEYDPLLYEADELSRLQRLRDRVESSPALSRALSRVNFPHFPTLYPPTSQLAFAASALVASGSERVWRAIAATADCLVALLLVHLLSALGRPRWWAAAYALHPLPALESSAGGHQDALGIALLAAAAAVLVARPGSLLRKVVSGSFLALSAGVKVFPLLLTVAWRRSLGVPGLAAVVATAAVLIVPFALLGPIDPAGLSVYVQRWEYFSGPYAVLSAPAAWLTPEPAIERWFGRGMVMVAFGVFLWMWRRRVSAVDSRCPDVVDGLIWVEALILLSPVVNPWYVPWALLAGAVRGSLAWPVFALLVPLAYLPFSGPEHPLWLRAVAWLPLLILLLIELGPRGGPGALGRGSSLGR